MVTVNWDVVTSTWFIFIASILILLIAFRKTNRDNDDYEQD